MSAMPPKDWYVEWVVMHVGATAAGPDATAALIAARDVAIDTWEAAEGELWECTNRLLRTMRTPKFANEHVDAIGTELVVLRADRVKQANPIPQSGGEHACPRNCSNGLLLVLHPRCVLQGRLINYRFDDGTDYGRLQFIVVICDECPRGEAELAAAHRRYQLATEEEAWKRKKHMSYSVYRGRIDHTDGLALLHERQEQDTADHRAKHGSMNLKEFKNISAMLAGDYRVPFKPSPIKPSDAFKPQPT